MLSFDVTHLLLYSYMHLYKPTENAKLIGKKNHKSMSHLWFYLELFCETPSSIKFSHQIIVFLLKHVIKQALQISYPH